MTSSPCLDQGKEAADLWGPLVFGSFLPQGWQELLMRHRWRDKSLWRPMVGVTEQMVLSVLTQGCPQLPAGHHPTFHTENPPGGFNLTKAKAKLGLPKDLIGAWPSGTAFLAS